MQFTKTANFTYVKYANFLDRKKKPHKPVFKIIVMQHDLKWYTHKRLDNYVNVHVIVLQY